ncbi:MAG: hypothetical protein ACD_75C01498G0001, partial [uncultured bacterium]
AGLGLSPNDPRIASLTEGGVWGRLSPGSELQAFEALFPRLEGKKEAIQQPKTDEQPIRPVAPPAENLVDFELFKQLELRVAEITAAELVKKSKKLVKLTVLAPEERTIVAGIAEHYRPEELVGRQVIIAANLKPAKIMGVTSHGMVLAAKATIDGEEKLVLSSVSEPVEPGCRVS